MLNFAVCRLALPLNREIVTQFKVSASFTIAYLASRNRVPCFGLTEHEGPQTIKDGYQGCMIRQWGRNNKGTMLNPNIIPVDFASEGLIPADEIPTIDLSPLTRRLERFELDQEDFGHGITAKLCRS